MGTMKLSLLEKRQRYLGEGMWQGEGGGPHIPWSVQKSPGPLASLQLGGSSLWEARIYSAPGRYQGEQSPPVLP